MYEEKMNGFTPFKYTNANDFLTPEEKDKLLREKNQENIEMMPLKSPGTSSLSSVDSKAIKSPSTPEGFLANKTSPSTVKPNDLKPRPLSTYSPIKQPDE